jgi:hypothetical protein
LNFRIQFQRKGAHRYDKLIEDQYFLLNFISNTNIKVGESQLSFTQFMEFLTPQNKQKFIKDLYPWYEYFKNELANARYYLPSL